MQLHGACQIDCPFSSTRLRKSTRIKHTNLAFLKILNFPYSYYVKKIFFPWCRKTNFPPCEIRKRSVLINGSKWIFGRSIMAGQYKQNPPWTKQRCPFKKKLWSHYDSTAYLVFLVAKADNGAVLIPAVRLKGEDASAVVSQATQNSS